MSEIKPYEYAISEGGWIRCCNCEAIKGDPHTPGCTGGSLLVSDFSSDNRIAQGPSVGGILGEPE